jgi:hypothetical protein
MLGQLVPCESRSVTGLVLAHQADEFACTAQIGLSVAEQQVRRNDSLGAMAALPVGFCHVCRERPR